MAGKSLGIAVVIEHNSLDKFKKCFYTYLHNSIVLDNFYKTHIGYYLR